MPLMDWLSIPFAIFLVWLIVVILFTPAINYRLSSRTSVHDAGFLYTIQSTCQAALARGQPRRDPHQRHRVLPGDDRGDPRRHPLDQHGALHLPAGQDRRPVRRRRCRIAPATASTSRSSSMRSAASACAAGRFAACGRPAAASSRTSSCGGTRLPASTTARTASCSSSTGASRSPAGPASPTGGRSAARHSPPWRDTMARIEGPVVAALQGVAAENWLECCGEILTGPEYFPDPRRARQDDGVRRAELAVGPRDGLARHVSAADRRRRRGGPDQHALFSPRPSAAARADRARGARRRRLDRRAGSATDQRWVRYASRRMWGELLAAGIRIHEYPRR